VTGRDVIGTEPTPFLAKRHQQSPDYEVRVGITGVKLGPTGKVNWQVVTQARDAEVMQPPIMAQIFEKVAIVLRGEGEDIVRPNLENSDGIKEVAPAFAKKDEEENRLEEGRQKDDGGQKEAATTTDREPQREGLKAVPTHRQEKAAEGPEVETEGPIDAA